MTEPSRQSPRSLRRRGMLRIAMLLATVLAALPVLLVVPARSAVAADPCGPPVVSAIACENSKPGTPPSDWQISGAGDPSIQGFAAQISVQPGDTVRFKVKTSAKAYHFDVLRLGYYQGNGARKVASGLKPSATLPQSQPSCLTSQNSTGLIDCGNWAVSASWAVPADAVSGVYVAHLVRDDTGGESHIVFVVRNDSSHSDMLFQTSDETWEAYNTYGGNSLYTCSVDCPQGSPQGYKGASKVSYNRPFHSAEDDQGRSWVLYAEYAMIRFLEANGYDVSYTTGADMSASGARTLLGNHKTFLSVGHDEYWSGTQRANVESARDSGLNLAFFSGNEVFWKTRFESSIDGSGTANRTLVSYKDTHYDAPVDPVAWTGTWQDPRFSPPGDGGRPQNRLTGQLFQVNSGTTDIRVPAEYAKMRFWRNTDVARLQPGQTLTLAPGAGTLGYEWDVDADNGFRPPGLFDLSSTTSNVPQKFTDYGSTITSGPATHNLTLYRASSGALVFGAGTVQWSWGLGSPDVSPDVNMQQATVNLFADMAVQPYSLTSGLTAATASADSTAPTSTITSPVDGASVGDGAKVTISGTASDTGGTVAGVEVSVDGGATWHPATGTTSWSYSWVAHGHPSTDIKSRAVDDSGNLETPGAGVALNVGCSCSIWGTGATPAQSDSGDGTAVEVGVKFKSDQSGVITGIRFYKSSKNTGTHVGSLWTASGTKLASATFSNESSTGWQQVTFSDPVPVNANNTYVASYFAPAGHTAVDEGYMFNDPAPGPYTTATMDSPPLHALRNSNGTINGVYRDATSGFPTKGANASNYWVDVMFTANTGPATAPAAPTSVSATPGDASALVTWAIPSDGGSAITKYTVTPYVGTTAGTPTVVTGSPPDATVKVQGLTNGTTYAFKVSATNSIGTGPDSSLSNTVVPTKTSCTACTLWPSTATPNVPDEGDTTSTEVGVKFKADVGGQITGLRYYKASANTGTHVGHLWTASGTKLASVTFTNESAIGWQEAHFATPVTISPDTVYVASYYAPNGHYAGDGGYFAGSGVDSGPLHALQDGVSGGNGVYRWSSTSVFPDNTYDSENYWVDVLFSTAPATAPGAPGNVTATAGDASATVSWSAPADGGSAITKYTVTPYDGGTALAPTTVTGTPPATKATVSGLTNGTAYTFRVSATNAVGTGPESAASAPVTPGSATAPGAPGNVTATAGDASATVSWSAPADGGSAITKYTVTPYDGGTALAPTTVTGTPPATKATVSGLTNGTAYTFRVSATNAVGTGPESAASAPVTPGSATAPGAPGNVTATAADASATVSWSAPADGGSAITKYTVTPYDGGTALAPTTVTGTPPATKATVSGLTNGTAYTFRVSATNAVGTGPESAASAPVTPVAAPSCSGCTIWPATATPTTASAADPSSVELGVKFKADSDGMVTGLRFYKGSGNTGTHVGSLWSASGTKLASATFTGESATGWQQVNFASPVAVTAGTVYVASYHAPNGNYAADGGYFAGSGVDNGMLHALQDGVSGGNGVFAYAGSSTFPGNSYNATNYWVDVVFDTGAATAPGAPGNVTATAADASATVSWGVPSNGGSAITKYTVTPYDGGTALAPTTVTGTPPATKATVSGLTNGTAYTFRVSATNAVGTGPESAASAPVTPVAAPSCSGCTIWPATATPTTASAADPSSVELGVKFKADSDGMVTGLRFYKGSGNTGTHVGSLWSASGTKLASATFTGESATGWQQVNFASPVAVTAGTVYVASYHAPNGNYAADGGYFAGSGVDNGMLHALQDGVSGGNGVFAYAGSSTFPGNSYNATNYWVDVVFDTGAATAPGAPGNVTATAADASATVSWGVPSNGGSAITKYTVTPYDGGTALAPTTVTGTPPATKATVSGLTNGTAYTFRVSATNAVGTGPESAASAPVTPVAAPSCSGCTIWPATATPTTASAADPSSVELGVKFKADSDGMVTGLRFYKGSGNTGTHVGSLWSASGTKLASATFTGESATGWQQVNFASPVAVTAGTVYVASYHAPNGNYAADGGYFAGSGVDNGMLHALQDGVSGGNGVFAYAGSSTFPGNSYNATNYWVDVVFTTG